MVASSSRLRIFSGDVLESGKLLVQPKKSRLRLFARKHYRIEKYENDENESDARGA